VTEALTGREGLRLAETDLVAARALSPLGAIVAAQITFLCQQCAKRALKGVLSEESNSPPPNTHEIAELVMRLQPAEPPPPSAAEQLTRFAIDLRYAAPETVTTDLAATALQTAEEVLAWARKRLAAC
jgi:HEPN domain-containing protein